MNIQRIAGLAATAAIGWLAGWQMQPSAPAAPARAPVATAGAAGTAVAAQSVAGTTPQIIIASDGNATIHVDQQPLA